MKALSIMQPWAWFVAEGFKPVENRDWSPRNPALRFRGPFLIHTGLKADGNAFGPESMQWMAKLIAPAKLPEGKVFKFGGIIGYGEIVDVVTYHRSPWFFGPIGLVIKNAKPLPFFPCKGRLGFFDVDYPFPDLIKGGKNV
ncbi:MAG: hypothetical protein WBK55_02290 [Alphaproteobacteria bacterium]